MGAAVVTGAALGLGQDTAPSQVPATNIKVVKFAESHKGKQVGNGECWTLAAEALAAAGAPRPGADGVDVFDFGRKLTEGTFAEIAQDRAVVEAYLGEDDDA